jgi:hypothetical protein
MKTVFLFAAACIIIPCSAQSLKDSLFSGKLKADSNLVKKSKINEQKPVTDTAKKMAPATINKAAPDSVTGVITDNPNAVLTDSVQAETAAINPPLRYEDNNKVWKKFTDQHIAIINSEVLPSKKIKKGTYSVMIEYEIGTDGVVTTKNVTSTPSNDFLVEQVKERMMANAPQLAPMIRDGVPRKSSRRQVFNFTKEKN